MWVYAEEPIRLPTWEDIRYWIFLVGHFPIATVPFVLGITIAVGTWSASRRGRNLLSESKVLQIVAYIVAGGLVVFGGSIFVLVFGGCC